MLTHQIKFNNQIMNENQWRKLLTCNGLMVKILYSVLIRHLTYSETQYL